MKEPYYKFMDGKWYWYNFKTGEYEEEEKYYED